jgi:hypothetical protein
MLEAVIARDTPYPLSPFAYAALLEAVARAGRAAEIVGHLLDARAEAPELEDRIGLGDLAHAILVRAREIDLTEGSWFERGMDTINDGAPT